MNKAIFTCLLIMISLSICGQATFGVLGGASLTKTSQAGSSNRAGIFIGGTMHLNLGNYGSFRPQLKYVMKGESAIDGKGTYNYLELPLNIVGLIPSGIGRWSLGGGPAFSYMFNGSWTAKGAKKEKIYFDYDKVNQFDFGVNLLAGLEIRGGVLFSINYTHGMANVWQESSIGKNKSRAIGIGVGVLF